ncbi:glycoside hydrolase family 55 protein [Sphingomonas sp. Leaf37]|uniref:glycoside hydrolase family 55 protein n=1 Tax=Sphingomonas sp. Leaf37 TaxID=2876552 RepID=UPI001E444D64|nr:glycoside hydrolase family 55 protein [Sphingomonas sp. Leaf37]
MSKAAYLPIVADRYGACVRHLFVEGVDLTGIGMRAQVRLDGDTPGAPFVDLLMVSNGNAEGLRLVEVTIDGNGLPTSHIEIVINETTLERLPYAGEIGDATQLRWDMQITIAGRKRRLARGEFEITGDGITGADVAPANRVPGRGRPRLPVSTPWSAARLTFGEEQVTVKIVDADLVAPLAKRAGDAADRAEADRASAELAAAMAIAASRYFPTRAAGEAASSAGQLFATDDGSGSLIYYKKVSSGSNEVARALTPAALAGPGGADKVSYDGRSVLGKLSDFVSVKDTRFSGGAKGDGIADDTAAVQAAMDFVGRGGTLLFPTGIYKVTTLVAMRAEANWVFQNAKLLGGATEPTDCLLRFGGLHCCIENMQIDLNFNLNYTCALWHYNANDSSQHNSFVNLEIRYAKRGIIYGEMPGLTSTYYAQSENNYVNYRTRGVQNPLYNNHANGFAFLVTPHLVAHDEEWATRSPGNFDTIANRSFEIEAGNLMINGGEIQNTIDPLGFAADIMGGTVYVSDVITEVSVPFRISGSGVLNMSGGRVLNTQSVTPQFKIAATATAGAKLKVSDVHFERPLGTGGFSDRPLVDNTDAPAVNIAIINCQIDEWARNRPLVSARNESVTIESTRWMPDGSNPTDVFRLDSNGNDMLDLREIDRTGNTTEGYYPVGFFGEMASGQSSDVPTPAFATSMFTATVGEAGFFTADGSSLAALKRTATRGGAGDRFLVEGWIRRHEGDNVGLALIQYDGAGARLPSAYLMVADVAGGFVTNVWRYVRQVVVIPQGSAAVFVGPGMVVKQGQGRFCGLQMRRADWNRR